MMRTGVEIKFAERKTEELPLKLCAQNETQIALAKPNGVCVCVWLALTDATKSQRHHTNAKPFTVANSPLAATATAHNNNNSEMRNLN